MKKFSFSLERVYHYRRQVEDSLRSQHGQKLRQVKDKEDDIAALERDYDTIKRRGIQLRERPVSAAEIRLQGRFMDSVVEQIHREQAALSELEEQAEQLRNKVVEAKQETESIRLLKDKKRREYDRMAAKEQEQELEEFVSNKSHRAAERAG